MTRTLLFDSPLLLGFDHTRALVERAARIAGDVYPPYNIEDCAEGRIRITLAVAGFTREQLSVTVEDNQLTIVGKRESEAPGAPERAFLHRPGLYPRLRPRRRAGGGGSDPRGRASDHRGPSSGTCPPGARYSYPIGRLTPATVWISS
jgi:hypothetical protein